MQQLAFEDALRVSGRETEEFREEVFFPPLDEFPPCRERKESALEEDLESGTRAERIRLANFRSYAAWRSL